MCTIHLTAVVLKRHQQNLNNSNLKTLLPVFEMLKNILHDCNVNFAHFNECMLKLRIFSTNYLFYLLFFNRSFVSYNTRNYSNPIVLWHPYGMSTVYEMYKNTHK